MSDSRAITVHIQEGNVMISEGYEKALFDSPVSERWVLEEPRQEDRERGHGAKRAFSAEFHFLQDLRRAARVIKRVTQSQATLFRTVARQGWRTTWIGMDAMRLGADLMALRNVTQETMQEYFPQHGFNPYVDLLFEARRVLPDETGWSECWQRATGEAAVSLAKLLNEFVAYLRKRASEPEFKKALNDFRRTCDKNTRSLRIYLDEVFKHCGGRHLVIRIDLGYAMEEAWAAARPTSVTLREAKRDWARFERHLRANLPYTGYAAKLEYGLLRGYHFHVLILLNGHLMQSDVLIAKLLGEHWASVICEGKGRYWNCNAREYQERGVGMVEYHDGDKRIALVNKVAGYLTKTDFWLRFQPGGKTFFRGQMPRPRPNRGRPRES